MLDPWQVPWLINVHKSVVDNYSGAPVEAPAAVFEPGAAWHGVEAGW
jgi:hypothetical protein